MDPRSLLIVSAMQRVIDAADVALSVTRDIQGLPGYVGTPAPPMKALSDALDALEALRPGDPLSELQVRLAAAEAPAFDLFEEAKRPKSRWDALEPMP